MAIDVLYAKKPTKAGTDQEFNDAMQWEKVQKSVKDLFGIKVDGEKHPQDKAIVEQLDRIRNVFNSIAVPGAPETPVPALAKDKKRLFCGDGHQTYIKPGDPVPGHPEATGAAPDGSWLILGVSTGSLADQVPDRLWKAVPPPPGRAARGQKVSDPPCNKVVPGQQLGARTSKNWNMLLICDETLESPATLKELKATIHTDMSLNDKSLITVLSKVMLHEFIHLYNDIGDLRCVKIDRSGRPEMKDDVPARSDRPCYGYLSSYLLAQYVPRDAPKTADTFVMFAMSIYFKDWVWVGPNGLAKPVAKKP
ncbi:hypothetical protein MMC24_007955 [Lignoscripta atroalba]|nr:hypothetical protein [Lignoscripta atroalba]